MFCLFIYLFNQSSPKDMFIDFREEGRDIDVRNIDGLPPARALLGIYHARE